VVWAHILIIWIILTIALCCRDLNGGSRYLIFDLGSTGGEPGSTGGEPGSTGGEPGSTGGEPDPGSGAPDPGSGAPDP